MEINEWMRVLMIEKRRLNRTAHQKFLTSKPGTIALARSTRIALRTKMKRPKLRMVRGRVRRIKTGLRMALMRPRTAAAMMAAPILLTFHERPG